MSDAMRGNEVVDWQISNKSNAQRARHLLETGLHHDCEFLVGPEGQQQDVKAHRIILSMGSPVFETMFYGGLAVSRFPIEISDVQPEAFRSLLEYIYTERLSFSSFSHACDVCYAAKKYIVPSLVQFCSDYMWKDLGPDNVCRAIEFSNFYEDTTLMERCMKLVRTATQQVLVNPSFEEAEEQTVTRILRQDELSASELDLFQALLRWGRKECTRRELPHSELRQVVNGPLSNIRFLAMTAEQFASGPALSGILSVQESHDIFMNLSSRGICPLPPNLSSISQTRTAPTEVPAPRTTDASKIFCYRRIDRESVIYNEGILDASVTFNVDRNVCIHGIIIATQVPRPSEDVVESPSTYMELLYCHLLDKDGTRLTYAHFSGRSVRNSTLDIYFNRPVYVQRNREYRLCVVLNRTGYYPLGEAARSVLIQGIFFRFGSSWVENRPTAAGVTPVECVRDAIIRGVIFTF